MLVFLNSKGFNTIRYPAQIQGLCDGKILSEKQISSRLFLSDCIHVTVAG
jgi:hypothetical protein